MGLPAKPPVMRLAGRAGIALPGAIFGMVIVGMITAGSWWATKVDFTVTSSRVDAAIALRLAHTAETHALAVLRNRMQDTTLTRLLSGFDNVPNTADDGLLVGYPPLGDSLSIPAIGRVVSGAGRYYVTIIDDPLETDGLPFLDTNRRVLLSCRGVSASGASAEVKVVVSNFTLPALAVDGDVEIASAINTTSTGACGGIHANGDISGGGTTTVAPPAVVTATGAITHNLNGIATAGVARLPIPDLNPSDFCGFTGAKHIGTGASSFVWKPGSLPLAGHTAPVTYCVTGNVEVQADFGSPAAPANVTVIASGSIELGGKKIFMKAAHPDGIVLMAGGDVDLQGDAGFEGMIYAGGQCYISGKPTITGQFLCKNRSPHPGIDYVQLASGTGLLISGDATFTFTCNSMLSSVYGVVAWYPTIGN